MNYAYYIAPDKAGVKNEPGWYDEGQGVKDKDIVGWAIWFNDGSRFCSLSTNPSKLSKKDIVQTLLVWHYLTRDPECFGCCHYTREVYPIPMSDVVLKGGWTDMFNHDKITRAAAKEQWPPSWEVQDG